MDDRGVILLTETFCVKLDEKKTELEYRRKKEPLNHHLSSLSRSTSLDRKIKLLNLHKVFALLKFLPAF